jgi:hypothetical protein
MPSMQGAEDTHSAGVAAGKRALESGMYRPGDPIKIEKYRAAGHAKVAGKHIAADGLVSRGGKRRILPV